LEGEGAERKDKKLDLTSVIKKTTKDFSGMHPKACMRR
jgi:hypothetical protein